MNEQALTHLVIKELSKHKSREQVVRTLCEQRILAWTEAEAFVIRVERSHRRQIASGKSPFVLGLAVMGIVGGIALVIFAIFCGFTGLDLALIAQLSEDLQSIGLQEHPGSRYGTPSNEERFLTRAAYLGFLFLLGLGMIAGSILGTFRTIAHLLR